MMIMVMIMSISIRIRIIIIIVIIIIVIINNIIIIIIINIVVIIINIIILNTLILVTIITTTTIIIITINIFAKNCIRLRLLSFVSSFARAHHGIVHDDIGLRADRSITPQIGHQTGSPGSCRKLKELQGDIICIF